MARYPNADWKPVLSHGLGMNENLGLILHVQAGNGSLRGEFSNPLKGKSSTWWISKAGTVEQYVDSDQKAWTQAAGNTYYNSVETEGQPDEPLTDAQIAALADLYRWGHLTHGWKFQLAEHPGDEGLGWHGMGGTAWGNHPNCPGGLRRAQRQLILTLASSNQTQGDDVPLYRKVDCPTGGYWLVRSDGGVYAYNDAGETSGPGVAPFYGSMAGHPLNAPVTGLEPHVQDGLVDGYWLYALDGGVFGFGGARVPDSYPNHPDMQNGSRTTVGLRQKDPGYELITVVDGSDPPQQQRYDFSRAYPKN